jgi:lipopolysaccharide export system protein LptA
MNSTRQKTTTGCKQTLRSALWLLLLLGSKMVFAQASTIPVSAPEQQDTTGRLKVESSLTGEGFFKGGKELRKLSGQVRLRQNNTLVYCDTALIDQNDAILKGKVVILQGDTVRIFADSAHYFGTIKQSDLFGKVVLENNTQKLFTKRLHYDLANKIATYNTGATMHDGKSQLTSRRGFYFVNDKQIFFKGNVAITDPEFTLRTDTMWYDTEARIAHFVAPTLISQLDGRIYCEGGFYNIEDKYAQFDKNPQYERKDQRGRAQKMRYNGVTKAYIMEGDAYVEDPKQKAEADMIWYNTELEQILLTGNARYRDSVKNIVSDRIFYDSRNKNYTLRGRSRVVDPPNIVEADSLDFNDQLGNGQAVGNVFWQDTTNKMTILAYQLDYNKATGFIHTWGGFGPERRRGRPLMKTLIDKDTLYMASDTISSFKPDTASDRRLLIAHRDVRIYKNNLQAVCDSLSFDSRDSTFRFFQFKQMPVLWSDTSQFSGDTILLTLRNNKPYKILLQQNALVVNSADEQYFNQIKGRHNTIQFEDGKAREMFVEGNAEAVYYALDDQKAYIGVNETQCGEMRLLFADGKVESIKFYAQSRGKFQPIKKAGPDGKVLKGFFWEKDRRPASVQDLLKPVDGVKEKVDGRVDKAEGVKEKTDSGKGKANDEKQKTDSGKEKANDGAPKVNGGG